jgi:hypothetical protein
MHRPRMRIEISFHDPAFAEFSDSLFHHRRRGAGLDESASIAAKQNKPHPAEARQQTNLTSSRINPQHGHQLI